MMNSNYIADIGQGHDVGLEFWENYYVGRNPEF